MGWHEGIAWARVKGPYEGRCVRKEGRKEEIEGWKVEERGGEGKRKIREKERRRIRRIEQKGKKD